MERKLGEEDIKGLEAEIDSAVDRLFVEKKGSSPERASFKQPVSEPSHEPPKVSLDEVSFRPSGKPLGTLLQEDFPKASSEPSRAPLREESLEPPAESLKAFLQEDFLKPAPEASKVPLREESLKPPAESLKAFLQEDFVKPTSETSRVPLREDPPSPPEDSFRTSLQEDIFVPRPEEPKTSLRQDYAKVPTEPFPSMKPFEMMETQVLSLEWEITRDNIQKTVREVLTLREASKGSPDITSILNLMAKVLTYMMRNEEHIEPSQIKFLLDSKETIKLLMKKELGSEWNIYKQLLLGGIEARFLCLDGLKETMARPPSPDEIGEKARKDFQEIWGRQIEGRLNTMELSIGKVEKILEKMNQDLGRLGQIRQISPEESMKKKSSQVGITILQTGESLFGIESEKIFKLFKVSRTFRDKVSSQQRIRLKDLEIQMIDLKKIFFGESKCLTGDVQILTVQEDGKYRGLMVDQVLRKFSTEADFGGDYGEYFSGMIHWTYQERARDVPILNLRKI